MFRGRYPGTVDAKGRLSIPAKFRDVLARYEGRELVVVPDGECLEVDALPEGERMEGKLREQSRFNSEGREISRLYVSRAKDVAMDGAGRILLAPDTRKHAGLDKNVTLVGGGLDKLEMWDRARFDEYDRTGARKLASLYDKLSALGV